MSELGQGMSKGIEACMFMAFKAVRTKKPGEDEKGAEDKNL